jgi:hypothetical protein
MRPNVLQRAQRTTNPLRGQVDHPADVKVDHVCQNLRHKSGFMSIDRRLFRGSSVTTTGMVGMPELST